METVRDELLPDRLTPSAVVSLVFHPLLTPVPAGILILWLADVSLLFSVLWIALCGLIVVAPLAVYILVMKSVWGQDTSVREHRHQLYVIGIALTITLILVLRYLEAPLILRASIYSGALAGFLGGVMNRWVKVSLHVGVSTGITIVLLSIQLWVGLFAGVLTVVVAAARYEMRHHTVPELIIGFVIPTFSVVIGFEAAGLPIL